MADPRLAAMFASMKWMGGVRHDPVLGDVPAVATGAEQPPAPTAEDKPKPKAKPKASDADTEAMARILSAVLYSPTPAATVDTSSGAVPIAKLGLQMQPQPEGYPVALDTKKLQPGDLAVLSAFLAKQKGQKGGEKR